MNKRAQQLAAQAGFTVHSIHKEWVESRDDSDESIVDMGEL